MNIFQIIKRGAEYYQLKPQEIQRRRRDEPFSTVRAVIIQACQGLDYEVVAAHFGLASGTSVYCSQQSFRARMSVDPVLQADFKAISGGKALAENRRTWLDQWRERQTAMKERRVKRFTTVKKPRVFCGRPEKKSEHKYENDFYAAAGFQKTGVGWGSLEVLNQRLQEVAA